MEGGREKSRMERGKRKKKEESNLIKCIWTCYKLTKSEMRKLKVAY